MDTRSRTKRATRAGGLGAAVLVAGGLILGAAPGANASSNQTPNNATNGGTTQEWTVTSGDAVSAMTAREVLDIAGNCAQISRMAAPWGPKPYLVSFAGCSFGFIVISGASN